mgnify:CR=1 FL=1
MMLGKSGQTSFPWPITAVFIVKWGFTGTNPQNHRYTGEFREISKILLGEWKKALRKAKGA